MASNRIGLTKVAMLLSSYWVIYVVVSATIIGVVLETGIIRISGFGIGRLSSYVTFYLALSIFSVFSQIMILIFVSGKVEKSLISRSRSFGIIRKVLVPVQLFVDVLIIAILFEIFLTYTYQKIFLSAIILTSFLTAGLMTTFLSWQFIKWIKVHKTGVNVMYLLAALFISASAISGSLYFLDQLQYQPVTVHPKQFADFIEQVEKGNPLLAYTYAISSAIAFVFLWLGTVYMLKSYQKRFGNKKYWVVMSIPLFYFLSQFQPIILDFFLSYASNNVVLFDFIYILMEHVSRPIGGVLFGFAFIHASQKVQNQKVRDYLVVTGIGLLLLFVSYDAQGLITTPFPPLGLLSGSYFGLSCYLILIGIYTSALSVSQDSILRASIRKSVETEMRFLKSIGDSEMNNKIFEKVLRTSRHASKNMPEETGISSSLTDQEIREYVKKVLELALKKKIQRDN
jgi:hypothetical protein